jgi:pimeloyl-ACP methyl ester carboxylesterase
LTQVKAGHFVPEDAPDEVEELILGFFSDNLL